MDIALVIDHYSVYVMCSVCLMDVALVIDHYSVYVMCSVCLMDVALVIDHYSVYVMCSVCLMDVALVIDHYSVYVMCSVCLMDVALVIDHSGSIRDNNKPGAPDNWGLVIGFIKEIVKKLKVRTNISIKRDHITRVTLLKYQCRLDIIKYLFSLE